MKSMASMITRCTPKSPHTIEEINEGIDQRVSLENFIVSELCRKYKTFVRYGEIDKDIHFVLIR